MKNFLGMNRNVVDHWVYKDIYSWRVWSHILFRTQYQQEPNTFQHNGYWVTQEYGEFIYGRDSWSSLLQVPEQRLRTIMEKFEKEGMIKKTKKKLQRGTMYFVENYAKFNQQDNQRDCLEPQRIEDDANQQDNQRPTSDQPATNQRLTAIKKDKKEKKEKEDIFSSDKQTKTNAFIKPTVDEVAAYCQERKNGIDAEYFIDFYVRNGWIVGRNKMADWKATIRTWERNNKKRTDGYSQPRLDDNLPSIQEAMANGGILPLRRSNG